MHRRKFLALGGASAALSLALPAVAEEPFPVYRSDQHAVDFRFRRRDVAYKSDYPPGTIVVDPDKRLLYLVKDARNATRFGVGVGKQGFEWSGSATIARKAKWPMWTPTPDQLKRYPHWKKWSGGFPGGPGNPLGARALYLYQNGQDTLYRIHGTVEPASIGRRVSSGCVRMINADVIELYERVPIGTRVIVL
jgi:lipoprotein-anchoring transpeptidase ErfK/SrfK